MLALLTDLDDPLADLRRFGIDAELAWSADFDGDALIYIPIDQSDRFERWWGCRPKALEAA